VKTIAPWGGLELPITDIGVRRATTIPANVTVTIANAGKKINEASTSGLNFYFPILIVEKSLREYEQQTENK